MKKRVLLFSIVTTLVCQIAACNNSPNTTNELIVEEEVDSSVEIIEPSVSEKADDSTIIFETIMTRYMIFVPTSFNSYKNGEKYQEGVDYWSEMKYKEAEECLLSIDDELQNLESIRYPEDKGFLKGTIGCLYIDMAKYDLAYDYLMDSYVYLRDRYGEDSIYSNTILMELCHYYYAVGNYERCIREINELRNKKNTYDEVSVDNGELKLFYNVILNGIEAKIYQNQARFADAYNLLIDSLNMCIESVDKQEDDSYSIAMEIDVLIELGDCAKVASYEEKWANFVNKCYEQALEKTDNYSGEYKEAKKAEILMKWGYFLCRFPDHMEKGIEYMKNALDIQEHLYGTDKTYAGLVDSYCVYAEFQGHILKDESAADLYYEKALDLCESSYEHNHPKTAMIYESMGRYYGNRREGYLQTAIEYYNEGIDIYKNLLIENHPMMAQLYLELAGAYKISGEEDRCLEYLERSKEIEDKLGYHHLNKEDVEEETEE